MIALIIRGLCIPSYSSVSPFTYFPSAPEFMCPWSCFFFQASQGSSNSSSLYSIHNIYFPVIKGNRGTVSLPLLVPGFGISLLSHLSWGCTVVSQASSPSVTLVFPAGWPISAADNVDNRCQLTLPTKCIILQSILFLLVIPLMRVSLGSSKGKEQKNRTKWNRTA